MPLRVDKMQPICLRPCGKLTILGCLGLNKRDGAERIARRSEGCRIVKDAPCHRSCLCEIAKCPGRFSDDLVRVCFSTSAAGVKRERLFAV